MSDLQDLVTAATGQAPDPKEENPLQILENRKKISPGVLIEKIRDGLQTIEKDPDKSWGVVSSILASLVASEGSVYSFRSPLTHLARTQSSFVVLYHAERASRDPDSLLWIQEEFQKLDRELQKVEVEDRKKAVVGSWTLSVDYLHQIWGDKATETLEQLTGAKRATVRRWLQGGTAQWDNARRVQDVASVLYDLALKHGWKAEDLQHWWQEPLSSGSTPAEIFATGPYGVPLEIQDALGDKADE